MKERERVLVTGLVLLLLIVWLGFVFHQSPRFAGSLWGGVLGVAGAVLMLVPLAYLVVKRVRSLKQMITRYVSMRTLLAWHIYTGILGPVLVLLHTGHKFNSPLGIALTAMTLTVVLSGFAGRYLMKQFSQEIREKKAVLAQLNDAYAVTQRQLAADPQQVAMVRSVSGFFSRLAASLLVPDTAGDLRTQRASTLASTVRLAEAIADVEYAIETHERFKQWFSKWLKIHIVLSVVLYVLLAFHVWAAIHFGLRWFE